MEFHQKQLKSVIMRLCLVFVLFGVIDYFFRTFTITELVDFFTWLQNPNWTFAKPPEKVNPYAEFNHGADIHSVAVSPVNSSLVACAGADNTIKLWNPINGNEITCIGHTKTVRCIAFSPAGDFNERATINKSKEAALENSSREKLPSTPAQPKITRLRFVVTDNDGIHQIQFQVPLTSYTPPPGYQISQNKQRNKRYWIEEKKKGGFILHGWQKLNGEKETTVAFELPYKNINKVQLSTIDMYGNMTWREFDINQFAAELLKTP